LYRLKDGEGFHFGFTNGLGNSYVWSIAEDTGGKLWVGNWGGGLFVRTGDRFKFAPGMEDVKLPVPALLAARDGTLWGGTSLGLVHCFNGRTNWFTEADGKSLSDVRTIAEDAAGTVWFGMAGNGLACLENGRIRQFHQADGLSSDSINCLHFDADGTLWIGTSDGGLCRLKQGHFSVIDRAQGLPSSDIGDIEDDGNGFFWMSSHSGIIRASKTELNDCADGKIREVPCLLYGINDGLPTIECSEGLQPAGCKTPDGRLWFPTTKGLVVVNPNEVRINHLPPPMALEELLVDGEPVTNTASPLRIPPGRNRFEFHYTGLSFVAPEKVSFKYRIEGLEKNWVDVGTKRVANYSFLPPGDYAFHVIACNNDGIWNETGVSLPFTLLPYFWQTWWFRVLGGLLTAVAAGGTVWFDTRRRMRRKLERIERQRMLEQKRARIAHDIHDDLGSQLTRITMLSESARNLVDDPKQAASDLHQIYDTGTFGQATFIHKDNRAAFFQGLFFNAGQVCFFQRAMAVSSRCTALPAGRWKLPPQPPQHPPNMAGMQADAGLPVDQFGHAGQGPKIIEESVGLGALEQGLFQLALVAGYEFGRPTQRTPFPGRTPDGFTLLFPAQRRSSTDVTLPGDFSLSNPRLGVASPRAAAPPSGSNPVWSCSPYGNIMLLIYARVNS
jgi:hypothetical protein